MENQKHFQLVRYFAYVTAPLIIVSIIIAAITHRTTMLDDLQKMGELTNITLGQTLSNTYARQLESIQAFPQNKEIKNNQPNRMINDLLRHPVNEFVRNTPVVRVNIFSLTGQTIFSTNNQQLNKTDDLEQHAITVAIKGENFSEMGMRPKFIKNDGTTNALMIVNTYIPINTNNAVIGVLELYTDVTSTYQEVQSGLQIFVVVLFLLGLLFFYTVIYFVVKAERIIQHKSEIEKRDHEYLKIAFKKSTESAKAKSEFLASMSHELRTPLNAIIGYSEILIEESSQSEKPSTKNDLLNIKSAGVHLKKLIEEILDHAKIESGIIDIQTVNCSLHSIVDSCVAYVIPDATKNGNEFIVEIDKNIQKINTDETKIKRIILNLISNANKFTRNGTIKITGKIDNSEIIIHVKDTGIGIQGKNFHKIFEPFTQVDNSYTRNHGGTGLGLTISQEYAKALGGDISVRSRVGKGTTMALHFPYCKARVNNNSIEIIKSSPAA